MKLANIIGKDGTLRLGVVDGDEIVDVTVADPQLPKTVLGAIVAGGTALDDIRAATGPRLARDSVALAAPIPRPPKILAMALNYKSHADEAGRDRPDQQLWFNKQATCVVGPYDDVHIPDVCPTSVDYEGELAVVIGRRCRHVPLEHASTVIAGYTVINDFSVRDYQYPAVRITMGKSFDTHGPTGPWLVTPDELVDPHRLGLRTWVNGELRQDANTSQMIFNCWEMIEHLTAAFTLEPGDVLATGTPAGVGLLSDPPTFLDPGDVVRVEIDQIGAIENRLVSEPSTTRYGFDEAR